VDATQGKKRNYFYWVHVLTAPLMEVLYRPNFLGSETDRQTEPIA